MAGLCWWAGVRVSEWESECMYTLIIEWDAQARWMVIPVCTNGWLGALIWMGLVVGVRVGEYRILN